MSETSNSGPVGSSPASGAVPAASTGASASGADQAAFSDSGGGNVGTMAALKEEYPKIYKYIMMSIAQNMCIEMQHRNQQLTQKMKKMSQPDQ